MVSQSRKGEIIGKHYSVNNHTPLKKSRLFWCEFIWQLLVHYWWDVINCYMFPGWCLYHVTDMLFTHLVKVPQMDLYKCFSLWVLWGEKVNNITPFSFAKSSTLRGRCDWWSSSRSNIDLYFLNICSIKCSMNKRKSSPVIRPDLLQSCCYHLTLTTIKVLTGCLTQRVDSRETHEYIA
jgi:hypothetical protein